jgi:hypothetical protein
MGDRDMVRVALVLVELGLPLDLVNYEAALKRDEEDGRLAHDPTESETILGRKRRC